MLSTIIIFILVLGLLVFVHEFGHFYVAKASGMGVEEFGFGFPPRIFGLQKINGRWKIIWGHKPPLDRDQTVYSINWIPLGGFVKILGENNDHEEDPRSFINKPFWPRFWTLVAGVCMNVILAWILYSGGYIAGLPVAMDASQQLPHGATFTDQQTAVLDVVPGQPADKAGLKPNDVILNIDGKTFADIQALQTYIKENAGKVLTFNIQRGGQAQTLVIDSTANPPAGEGPTGIEVANVGRLKFPWYLAPWEGAKTTIIQVENIVSGLWQLIASHAGFSALGGPVKIAKLTGEVAGMGFVYLLQFTAFLSLNLAVLNILPFPALDGGRVLFLIIEVARGRRNNPKWEQILNTAGFLLLLMLMVAVTIQDIVRK